MSTTGKGELNDIHECCHPIGQSWDGVQEVSGVVWLESPRMIDEVNTVNLHV